MPNAKAKEITLECGDGMKLAGQQWEVTQSVSSSGGGGGMGGYGGGGGYGGMGMGGGGYGMGSMNISGGSGSSNTTNTTKTIRILCVHGLYDNCESFYYLAPNLVDSILKTITSGYVHEYSNYTVNCVAIDLPGHGKSTIRSTDVGVTTYLENIYYIAETIKQLKWDTSSKTDEKIILIGHSYGGSLALGYAATYPDHISKLILLDRASPKYVSASTTVMNMKDNISRRLMSANTVQTKRMVYDKIEDVITSRVNAAKLNPGGKQTISVEAAKVLVERGTRKFAGGYQFAQDIRLDWPLFLQLSEEQCEMINKAVKCPTCKLFADNGWPYNDEYIQKEDTWLKPTVRKILPGSHHFHADPTTCKAVLDEILKFIG